MTAGVHCAHFEVRELGDAYDVEGAAFVGVAGPGFDPAAEGAAYQSAEGWVMDTGDGHLLHGGYSKWAGQCEVKVGDVVVRRPRCAALRVGWR